MNSIGIISGGGQLPIIIGKNLIKKKLNVFFFVLEEYYDESKYKYLNVEIIKLNSAKKIIEILRSYKINDIILAGNINRPSITDLKFDFPTFKLAKKLLLDNSGDNDLLVSIKNFFQDNGFSYFDWKGYCPELFAFEDNLTIRKPSNYAKKNLKKALQIFKSFGKLDIGQSLIMQNQIVLGLEAVEGTDNLIARCKNLKKSGDQGVLVKLSKYKQSKIIDIPTIGAETINKLKKNNYEGLFIEKNHCLIIEKQKTIKLANELNIFISTTNKIEKQ